MHTKTAPGPLHLAAWLTLKRVVTIKPGEDEKKQNSPALLDQYKRL